MERLRHIFYKSKVTAKEIVNDKQLTEDLLSDSFSKSQAKDIVSELANESKQKERLKHVETIEKSKQKDWESIRSKSVYKTYSKNSMYKAAAILIVLLSISYLTYQNQRTGTTTTSESNLIGLPLDEITLDLGNGITKVLSDKNNSQETFDNNVFLVKQGDNLRLDYTSAKNKGIPNTLIYNELNVPYGRNFEVTLSDGTKVHLNSGSKLKYPIQFIKGEKRNVFLEGEAYFEVTKNKEQPFTVNADNMSLEVLGTVFNIMAYPEDSKITTVLVEGSVAISHSSKINDSKTLLKPNQQAFWNKSDGKINIKPVKPNIYTAWTEGRTVFEHMAFKNILKKLERRYNVKITNHNEHLANEEFTATFDYESITQVLTSFSKNYPFDFNIEDDKIIIN